MEHENAARPGDERFRKLSNGSKGRYSEALATRLVIANTGAMLTVGHEAPCRLTALACRTKSPDHTLAKGRTLDKFLALATRHRRG
jgi:hypothetical protein